MRPHCVRLHRLSLFFDFHSDTWVDEVQIYTDGSFDGVSSGWSVVLLGLRYGQPSWLRWFAGRVCTSEHSPLWMGASKQGVQEAELTALCYAQLWALSVCRLDSFGVRSDSLVSVQSSCGHWQCAADNLLARTCRSLAQATEAIGVRPWMSIQHIPAHQGHAWNELADTLAKAAVRCDPCFLFHLDIGAWVRDRAIESLWLILATLTQPRQWPQLQGSCLLAGASGAPLPGGRFFGVPTRPARDVASCKWRCLRIVTANVQSLDGGPWHDGVHAYEGRAGFIREQMLHHRVHVVALQEARTQRAETLLSSNYIRLCSGRTSSGHLGVEAWFLRQDLGDGISFSPEDLTVVHFTPRLLCVKVSSPHLCALVVVIHAPVAADAERDAWWAALHRTLSRVASGLPLLLVGETRIGEHVFPSKYPVSRHTWKVLESFDLWVPATFRPCHEGVHDTWYAPGQGASARLDYVAVPSVCQVAPGRSFILLDVDLGHRSLDHMAVFLEVWTPFSGGGRPPCRGPSYDRTAMSTPDGHCILRDICDRAPAVDWSVQASDHYHLLETYFVGELRRAFPPRARRRRDSFLTDATWVLRDHRIWLRRRAAQFRARCCSFDLFSAFCALRKDRGLACARLFATGLLCAGANSAASVVDQLRETRQALRRSLRADKRLWISEIARQSASCPTRDVVAKLRPLIQPRRRVKTTSTALPVIRLEDGSLALDEAQALDRWIRHFASNEGGVRCTPDSLVEAVRNAGSQPSEDPFTLRFPALS